MRVKDEFYFCGRISTPLFHYASYTWQSLCHRNIYTDIWRRKNSTTTVSVENRTSLKFHRRIHFPKSTDAPYNRFSCLFVFVVKSAEPGTLSMYCCRVQHNIVTESISFQMWVCCSLRCKISNLRLKSCFGDWVQSVATFVPNICKHDYYMCTGCILSIKHEGTVFRWRKELIQIGWDKDEILVNYLSKLSLANSNGV